VATEQAAGYARAGYSTPFAANGANGAGGAETVDDPYAELFGDLDLTPYLRDAPEDQLSEVDREVATALARTDGLLSRFARVETHNVGHVQWALHYYYQAMALLEQLMAYAQERGDAYEAAAKQAETRAFLAAVRPRDGAKGAAATTAGRLADEAGLAYRHSAAHCKRQAGMLKLRRELMTQAIFGLQHLSSPRRANDTFHGQ
jgi:hypothetical protein